MLREHRGKVVYIPIVVPDNRYIGAGHLLGVVAAIILVVCAASQNWMKMTVDVPAESEYEPNLTATLTFGLRSMHILYCEAYNQTVYETTEFDGCGFEDVYYSSCSQSNTWCAAHGNTTLAFAMLILDALLILATCAAALTKLGLLPTGFMISAWIALLAVASFKQECVLFTPSSILSAWMNAGTTTQEFQWAYSLSIASVFAIFAAVALATYGYIQAGREDARRTAHDQQQDSSSTVGREVNPDNVKAQSS